MKNEQIKIGGCDFCGDKVPECFLKIVSNSPSLAICHPCYSAGAKKVGEKRPFFEGISPRELERLRRSVPKFTEPPPSLAGVGVNSPEWSDAFAKWADRKAKWYGEKNVFTFFEKCLK